MVSRRLVASCALIACAPFAAAQQFNVDIDFPGSNGQLGQGVPSAAFGAASGQAGVWNSAPSGSGPFALTDINGALTGATLSITGTSSLLAFNNSSNTGDYALLMNDARQVGTVVQGGNASFTFAGLTNGNYQVWTYGAPPQGGAGSTVVDVIGSTSTNPQTVTGGANNNTFILGGTHVVHNVAVTNGTLTIRITDPNGDGLPAYINGFQLVPAPGGAVALLAAAGLLARRRRS